MQAIIIFLAIIIGILLPGGHELTFLIRYNLMVMLFFAFLNMEFHWKMLKKNHFKVLLLNLAIPLMVYALVSPLDTTVALAAFVIGVAPTAAVAPVIAGLLKIKIEFVTTSVVLTSLTIALILPFLLPKMIEVKSAINVEDILKPISIVVFVPLILSLFIKKIFPRSLPLLLRFKQIAFFLFLLNVYIASAKSSFFIRYECSTSWFTILCIVLLVSLLGLIMFTLGAKLGEGTHSLESSLALGRKNTMFALWIAITFLNPVVALGPMFYILFQNAYNSWQMWEMRKQA